METIKIVMAEGAEDLFPRKAHPGDAKKASKPGWA